jgi:Uma2 family endonuclease
MTETLAKARSTTKAAESEPFVIKFKPLTDMDDERFAKFCALNEDLRIERTAVGEIILMPPTFGPTGSRNAKITMRLGIWAERDGTGDYYDSSTGFRLPNGALRSPDAAWILNARLEVLTRDDIRGFIPLCPDFVIELRSTSDSLEMLQAKMQEYIDNGARLGWLVDPISDPKRVHIYRPQATARILDEPDEISGEPELSGFTVNLHHIWDNSV